MINVINIRNVNKLSIDTEKRCFSRMENFKIMMGILKF